MRNITDELQEVLELTAQQHRTKRAIDLRRASIDEHARTTHAETGLIPKWKIKGFGEIRLDGVDPDPKPVVSDPVVFHSWLAENHPAQVTATITVDPEHLEAALEVLKFAEITATAKLDPRPAGVTAVLSKAEIVDVTEEDAVSPSWILMTPEGEQIPGVEARISSTPTLKVIVDSALKSQMAEAADDEYAAQSDDDETGQVA